MQSLQLEDIQGIILHGYGKLAAAGFLLLAIDDAHAARHWLATLDIRTSAQPLSADDSCTQIAFTRTGLSRLGLDDATLGMFAGQFHQGMTASDHRRRILGDTGDSSPQYWRWGGPDNPAIDILLLCYAADSTALDTLIKRHREALTGAGLRLIDKLGSDPLPQRKEHFGFHDGAAQPAIAGFHEHDTAHNTIAAGEFILGYENAYGQLTERPLIAPAADPQGILPAASDHSDQHDFGGNGSYLVFRQLSQDVTGFWRCIDEHSRRADGSSDPQARIRLAANMVGRWPSGAPLVKAPAADQPELAGDNDFLYVGSDDGEGLKCPIGAHIRRTNPRDALDPQPGSQRSIEVGKRHRILRRGRSYGAPVAASMDPADILAAADTADTGHERGLHFLCFNSHIGRQFEFIQHTWVNNPKFDGLYDDDDPLLGSRSRPGNNPSGGFTIPAQPVRKRVGALPRFVQVRGGAYFFMPGLRAIRYLASLDGVSK
jgi:Dyp-type peroxidase family